LGSLSFQTLNNNLQANIELGVGVDVDDLVDQLRG
jgi:hypothetical protein